MAAEDIRKVFDAAEAFQAEPPRPLMRELPEGEPFPVDALGSILGAAATGIQEKIQAPVAMCGQSVLAAATLAVQAHVDVELPTGHAKPVSGFFLSIAATGERKSAVDTEALWPICRREQVLREGYEADLPGHLNDKAAWEKAREEALKKGKGDRDAIKLALDILGPVPSAPLDPMLISTEPTFEGLTKFYAGGAQPSLGIFSAEGGQFIGGHGMSDDNKLRTATGLSGLWDGTPVRRTRAIDGNLYLPGRRLAMHLMAQPDVASVMLADRVLADQGMLSRMLVTAPPSLAGTRMWREVSAASDAAIKKYGARLLTILEAPMPLALGKTCELEPRRLPLSSAARVQWIRFADSIEAQIGPGGSLERIKGLANKLPEHAARLAAVLQMVDDLAAPEVSEEKLAAGIALAEHYLTEALRLFDASRVSADLHLAQRLLTWLQTNWAEPLISLPDIYQTGPGAIRDKATAAKMVGILEDHGWMLPVTGGGTVNGKRRREAWRIVIGG